MKLALVDDELCCTTQIEQFCNIFSRQYNIPMELSSFQSGDAFLETYKPGAYSVVFMDICMKGTNGVETARKMREIDHAGSFLVFLTSSSDFMPDAFSCHAFDYLTKPVSDKSIFNVLKDILKYSQDLSGCIKITCNRKTIPVHINEIISVVSDAHYLEIQINNDPAYRSRMTVSGFLKLTGADSRFLSINKGILVNADYIKAIQDNCCFLTNGTQFPIRIRGCQEIEQAFSNYQFKKLRSSQWHI